MKIIKKSREIKIHPHR